MPSSASSSSLYNCILVKKNGTLKQVRYLHSDEMFHANYVTLSETSETYSDAFRRHAVWKSSAKYNNGTVELWARAVGRAGQENTYEFPPPVDEILFFGNCLLVWVAASGSGSESSSSNVSFTLDVWKKIYAKLFGGFHDLDKTADADEKEYDELEDVPSKHKTNEGYLKDGFIVEDQPKQKQQSLAQKRRLPSVAKSVVKPNKVKRGKRTDETTAAHSSAGGRPLSPPLDAEGNEIELEEEEYDDIVFY
jgi:hypothetical protein